MFLFVYMLACTYVCLHYVKMCTCVLLLVQCVPVCCYLFNRPLEKTTRMSSCTLQTHTQKQHAQRFVHMCVVSTCVGAYVYMCGCICVHVCMSILISQTHIHADVKKVVGPQELKN